MLCVSGDGSNKDVLKAAGVQDPLAVCVCYSERHRAVEAVSITEVLS